MTEREYTPNLFIQRHPTPIILNMPSSATPSLILRGVFFESQGKHATLRHLKQALDVVHNIQSIGSVEEVWMNKG